MAHDIGGFSGTQGSFGCQAPSSSHQSPMAMDDLLFQGDRTGTEGMETVGRIGEGRHGGISPSDGIVTCLTL